MTPPPPGYLDALRAALAQAEAVAAFYARYHRHEAPSQLERAREVESNLQHRLRMAEHAALETFGKDGQ